MAESIQFRMINDRTGEVQTATMANEADLRSQGFRVLDAGMYQAAEGAIRDAARVPVPMSAEQQRSQAQTYEDAKAIAEGGLLQTQSATPMADSSGRGTEEQIRATYEKATVDKLKQYAKDEGVDLQGATLKADIVDALIDADRAAGRITDDASGVDPVASGAQVPTGAPGSDPATDPNAGGGDENSGAGGYGGGESQE